MCVYGLDVRNSFEINLDRYENYTLHKLFGQHSLESLGRASSWVQNAYIYPTKRCRTEAQLHDTVSQGPGMGVEVVFTISKVVVVVDIIALDLDCNLSLSPERLLCKYTSSAVYLIYIYGWWIFRNMCFPTFIGEVHTTSWRHTKVDGIPFILHR